jgi:hypothetical protein
LSDYLFPSYPQAFDLYPNNAGYLSEPLFKLLFFGLLSTYSHLLNHA